MACQKVLTILSGERIFKKRLLGLQTGFLGCLSLKMKTNTLLRKIGNYFPVHTATKQPRNLDSANAVRIILLLCKD
jgi:hypothetical protein